MALASTVLERRVFNESKIAFQYMRSLTYHMTKLRICLCLNWLNFTSKYGFGFNGCEEACVQGVKDRIPMHRVFD